MVGLKEMQINTLLHNPQVKEEITIEIEKYFELNRNEKLEQIKTCGKAVERILSYS